MYNVFQQPWLLLLVAFVLLVVVYIIRSSFPDKQRWWHLLIPVLVAVGAFGLDYLVRTDHEKVKRVIESVIKATTDKDVDTIGVFIAEDYRDRLHPGKMFIMGTCKHLIKRYNFQSIVMTYHDIIVEAETADAEILVRVRIDPASTSMPTPQFVYAKLKLKFKKKPDETWVIKSTELVEVNKNSVNWKSY